MKCKRLLTRLFASAAITLIAGDMAMAQPTNDNCASATTLSVNASCTNGVTNAGTIEAGELTSCLGTGIDQTVWYQFVATSTDMDVVIIGNSANKCYFGSAIWDLTTSPCPVTTGTAILCEDWTGGPLSQKHALTGLVVSNTYLIQIGYNSGGACGSSVSFCIGVFDNEVSSDDCANAVNVTTYTSYTVSNAEATADMDLCSGSTENNIWFKWVVPSWWTPGALAYVHLYSQTCDISSGMQLSIFEKANCGQIPNPAAAGSPPGSYGDCIFWANTQTTNNIQYSWAADPGDIFYFDLDGFAGSACIFNFLVSPYACFTATATTTTAAPCPPATGGTATVTPSGVNSPFTYSWGTAPVQTTQTATGLTANTTYNVTVTDAVACQVVTSATVPGPAAAGFNTTGSFCTSGTGGTGVIFTNTGTSPADVYLWTFPSGTPATSAAENQTVTWAAAGTYAVSQDVTKDGCTQNSTQNVTIVDCTCPLTVNAGTDIVVCDNTTTTLNGSYSNATSAAPTYIINDNFEGAFPGAWVRNNTTYITSSTTQASSPTKSIYFNDNSGPPPPGGGASYQMYQAFTAQTVFTAEFKVFTTNNSQGDVLLTNGTSVALQVTWINGNLEYYNGSSWVSLGAMSQNAWHTIKLVVNTGTDTYDIYLDGAIKQTGATFSTTQTQINRIYFVTSTTGLAKYYIDDVQVYTQGVTIAWTVSPACAGCLSSTTILNPIFTPPIVAVPTIYTYTLCIQDDCSGACPNSKVDAVTVTVNHCCNLTADAASNDNDNDTTFNMCTQPTLVMAGAYTNAYYNPVNTYYINDNMEYATDAAWQAAWTVTEENASTTADPSTAQSVSPTTSIKFTDASGGGGGKEVYAQKTFTAISAGTAECQAMCDGNGWFNALRLYSGATIKASVTFKSDLQIWYLNGAAWNSLGAYTVNTFYSIKMVFDAAANTCEVFINGVSKYNGTLYNNAPTTVDAFNIRTDPVATTVGYVDDVKVYTTAPGVGPATVLWSAGTLNPGYPATGLSSTTILAPTFTPTAAGNYQFTLTVTDDCGTATSDMLVTITSNVCAATFSVNDASQDLGSYPVAPYNTFNFLNTGSTGSPWTYTWDMGGAGTYLNSSTSASENPDFTYNAAGAYTVTNTVSMPLTGACPATSCFTTIPVTVTLPPCSDTYRVYYQSRASGNWDALATWDFSCDAGATDPWIPAVSFLPNYVKKTVWIRTGHIVTITANVTVDEVIIDAGGTLIYNGGTLTINNGTGIDLIINGTFQDDGPNVIGW